jgi:hypothetical protein
LSQTRTLLYSTFLVLSLVSAGKDSPQTTGVYLQVLTAKCGQNKASLTWRITNNESKAVYLYSTFLRGPAAAFDQDAQGVLNLHTSLQEKIHAGVNFYPNAEFIELAPGGSLEGTFRDKQLCSELPAAKPREVTLEVAFGFDVAQVKEAVHSATRSSEHPANPIVDWQTRVRSKPVPLRY